MWPLTVAILASQIFNVQAGLRSRHGGMLHTAARGSASALQGHRTAALKTLPPFDIDPDTFVDLLSAVSTDKLLLFFSPTCPDCEKLMPQWSRVAGLFENNQDLSILSVSDDAGKAPPPYTHTENPAVFFIPKGDVAHPIPFPMSDLHQFVALPESPSTDTDIVNKIVAFTQSHLSTPSTASSVAVTPSPPAQPTQAVPVLSESQTDALNARLLASLKAKENQPLREQLEVVYEPHYQNLPVVEFLKNPTGVLGTDLVTTAATYLDGLPQAKQWANQYATQQDSYYRSQGWMPTPSEEQAYFQKMMDYAIPLYARSIYVQKGFKA